MRKFKQKFKSLPGVRSSADSERTRLPTAEAKSAIGGGGGADCPKMAEAPAAVVVRLLPYFLGRGGIVGLGKGLG